MRQPNSPLARALAMTLALMAATGAAQDSGSSREREALRRTQAALRQAQEQQAALVKDKSDLAAQRDAQGEAAKRAQSQLSSARADRARLDAALAQATDDLAATKMHADAERQAAQAQVAALTVRLAGAERVAAERTRSNAALAALLERATRSLAMAETTNRDMHAFGLQLIDRLRGRATDDGTGAVDPVLGFGGVKLENEAEALRDQLEALRLENVAKSPAGAK